MAKGTYPRDGAAAYEFALRSALKKRTAKDCDINAVASDLLEALWFIMRELESSKWAVQVLIDSPWLTRVCPEAVEEVVQFLEERMDGWEAFRLRRYGYAMLGFTDRLASVVAESEDPRAIHCLEDYLRHGPALAVGPPPDENLSALA